MRYIVMAVAVAITAAALYCGVQWLNVDRPWPLWQTFVAERIQADGRVIDFSEADDRSTSESQAYGLFLALVANDKARFADILAWTRNNLAAGDLSRNLPAWLWGRRGDSEWGVIDANSASDADLWIAYTLIEAGRLWDEPEYAELGRSVLANIREHETIELPGDGTMLLPGSKGFQSQPSLWRFNLSYTPPFLLAALERASPSGPWSAIAAASLNHLATLADHGLVPDWHAYSPEKGPHPDPATGPVGSYDAIRLYMWAGMWPGAHRWLEELGGMRELVAQLGYPPERVDIITGEARGRGPTGFTAALLPYLHALDARELLDRQRKRLSSALSDESTDLRYYDQVLLLFAKGWMSGRYRFDEHGHLRPAWDRCPCWP